MLDYNSGYQAQLAKSWGKQCHWNLSSGGGGGETGQAGGPVGAEPADSCWVSVGRCCTGVLQAEKSVSKPRPGVHTGMGKKLLGKY